MVALIIYREKTIRLAGRCSAYWGLWSKRAGRGAIDRHIAACPACRTFFTQAEGTWEGEIIDTSLVDLSDRDSAGRLYSEFAAGVDPVYVQPHPYAGSCAGESAGDAGNTDEYAATRGHRHADRCRPTDTDPNANGVPGKNLAEPASGTGENLRDLLWFEPWVYDEGN